MPCPLCNSGAVNETVRIGPNDKGNDIVALDLDMTPPKKSRRGNWVRWDGHYDSPIGVMFGSCWHHRTNDQWREIIAELNAALEAVEAGDRNTP